MFPSFVPDSTPGASEVCAEINEGIIRHNTKKTNAFFTVPSLFSRFYRNAKELI